MWTAPASLAIVAPDGRLLTIGAQRGTGMRSGSGYALALMLAVLILSAGLSRAQDAGTVPVVVDARVLSDLSARAATDPAGVLDELDRMLRRASAATAADPRILLDLQRLAAALLGRAGRWDDAAGVLDAAARLAARNRDRVGVDPATLWLQAADAHEKAGDPRGTLAALEGLLTEQRDGGLSGARIAGTLTRMAVLADKAGDAGRAAGFRTAAAEAAKPVAPGGTRGGGTGFSRVEVFYATDRARTGDSDPVNFYGYGRGRLDYGIAEVTVPDIHAAGAIEKPSIWRLEFAASPAKHVMLQSVTPVGRDDFFGVMRDRMAARGRKEAFVFIHGYNVSFASAAKRAAQLAYDMNFSGVPVLYSWPSEDTTTGYLADAAVVQLSGRRLSHFLDDLVARSGATTIHIVAHSMGNRALTEALELMALRRGQTAGMPPVFDQVVFAAPDVDAGLFAEMIPTIRPLARRMTLYGSENDWALATSRHLHGDAPRAGQGGPDTLAVAGIDSLDMTALGDDMLAHGYFANDRSALADLAALFWRNASPSARCGLEPMGMVRAVPTWRYEPGRCPDDALLAVIGRLDRDGVRTRADATLAIDRLVPDAALSGKVKPVLLRMLPP